MGYDPQAEREQKRRQAAHTLRSVAEAHLEARRPEWRDRTYVETERYLLTGEYFRPLLNTPIADITRADVSARLRAIIRANGPVAANRARSAISSLFSWAMGEGLVDSNPTIGTNAPKVPAPRERVLSDPELAAIWRACGDDQDGRVIRLLMLTAARRAEIGGMAWSEIDLDKGTWTLPASRAKNHRAHTLPLTQAAIEIITATPRLVGRDELFGWHASAGFTRWAQAKIDIDARLGDSVVGPWRFHDLRRSTATRLCDLGVMPHVVEQILNHRSGHRRGIVAVYNKSAYEGAVRNAMIMWSDHIRTLIEGGERKVLAFPQESA
jgi:integrase